MAIIIKTPEEIGNMRISGRILAEILEASCNFAKAGISTYELDQFAEKLIIEKGGKPAFKGYRNFPGTLCTCIDEEIVHGIPQKNKILKDGDLLTIDCGVIYNGMYTDAARSIGIGEISPIKQKLIDTANHALSSAIDKVKPGIRVNEISQTIEGIVKSAGFFVISDLSGHGVGKYLHEDPVILNYDDLTPGAILKEGMTLAIEPIFSTGTNQMRTLGDNWTIVTSDNSPSVQAENTVLITENGCEILTSA